MKQDGTAGRAPFVMPRWVLTPLTVALAATGGCCVLFFASNSGGGRLQAHAAVMSPLPSPSLPLPLPTISPALPKVTPPALPNVSPLPTPSLPTALPTAMPTTVPTPSLPASLSPSPTLPPMQPSATPSGSPAAGGQAAGGASSGGSAGNGGSGPGPGLPVPFTSFVIHSPLDAALLGAIAALPLLFGIWLLAFARTWTETRRSRDAQIRLAIAHDLGLAPRELTSVSTESLFKLREEAAFDELTGVLRRAAGISALDREVARARRQKAPLAVVFIDVDGLKAANDKRGHKAGDQLLCGLVNTLKAGLRGQDLVLRYGGDEFICVLPDTVAEAARAKMSWIQTEAEKAGIRFSAGVAQLERSDDVVSLLSRADTEMYAIKARRGVVRDLRLGVVGGGRKVSA
jgi:diguanylate cyclase (GGDEF)-like protein